MPASADLYYRRVQAIHVVHENDGLKRVSQLCFRSHELSVDDGALTNPVAAMGRAEAGEGLAAVPKVSVQALNLPVTHVPEAGNDAHCHIDVSTTSQSKKLLKAAFWVVPIPDVGLNGQVAAIDVT